MIRISITTAKCLVIKRRNHVHNDLSLTAPLSSCRLTPRASSMDPAQLIVGLPLLPSTSPNIIVFSTEPCPLMMS